MISRAFLDEVEYLKDSILLSWVFGEMVLLGVVYIVWLIEPNFSFSLLI